MQKLLNQKIAEQGCRWAICHQSFSNISEVVPDHKNPKGLGGGKRDDHRTIFKPRIGGAIRGRVREDTRLTADQAFGIPNQCELANCPSAPMVCLILFYVACILLKVGSGSET